MSRSPAPPDPSAADVLPVADALPVASGDAVPFLLRLARALHTYGQPAHRVEEALSAAARRLDVPAQFFSTPTSLFAAFGPEDRQHTFLLRVEPGDVHLEKLADLDRVATDALAGRMTVSAATARIEETLARAPRYRAGVRTLAGALSSGCAARFLGGGWREVVVAFGLGLLVALVARRLSLSPAARRAREPAAGFLAAFAASAILRLGEPFSAPVAIVSGLIALVPGLTLAVAMTELSADHLVSGTARVAGALVQFLAMALGVALGSQVAAVTLGPALLVPGLPLPAWTEFVALLVAPFSLAVVFQARPDAFLPILVTCIAGFAGGRLGAATLGPVLGLFIGAMTAGLASAVLSRRRREPGAVTLVPALLLLAPGSVGFRGLTQLVDRDVLTGVDLAFQALLMVSALTAGIVVAGLIAPPRRLVD